MIEMHVEIHIPQLWKEKKFIKDYWGGVNFLVGPNGTGKSLFAEQLRNYLTRQGRKTRLLNAERLRGLENKQYDAFGYSTIRDGFNIRDFNSYKDAAINDGLSVDAFIVLKKNLM